MKNVVNKLDKVLKNEETDPFIKQQIAKKKEILTNNKTVKK
jgi:hypothetical protein